MSVRTYERAAASALASAASSLSAEAAKRPEPLGPGANCARPPCSGTARVGRAAACSSSGCTGQTTTLALRVLLPGGGAARATTPPAATDTRRISAERRGIVTRESVLDLSYCRKMVHRGLFALVALAVLAVGSSCGTADSTP